MAPSFQLSLEFLREVTPVEAVGEDKHPFAATTAQPFVPHRSASSHGSRKRLFGGLAETPVQRDVGEMK